MLPLDYMVTHNQNIFSVKLLINLDIYIYVHERTNHVSLPNDSVLVCIYTMCGVDECLVIVVIYSIININGRIE